MRKLYPVGVILSAFLVSLASVSIAEAQGRVKTIELVNQLPPPEEGATARARVFEDNARGDVTLEFDIANLFCRSSGLNPIVPQADQLGAAFYTLWVTDWTGLRTRLHIFNTECFSQSFKSHYNFFTYFQRTGRTRGLGQPRQFATDSDLTENYAPALSPHAAVVR